MFSNEQRCQYTHNQLADVICQLRFPEILSINTNAPADFQEEIRSEFPQFSKTLEPSAPIRTGAPGNQQIQNQPPTVNYQFTSADGSWRINLTSKFISLACTNYTNWETFAAKLDKPLVAFIRVYKPAYFERIGLRYLNFISRKSLGLENMRFSDLFAPQYLGLLMDEEIDETNVLRSGVDVETKINGGCQLRIHAGPGIVTQNGVQDSEIRFIFDQDIFMNGNIPVNYSAGALQTLHSQAFSIFRAAITDTLHDAMIPRELP